MMYQQIMRKTYSSSEVSNYSVVLAQLLLKISGLCDHLALVTFSHIT